MMHDIMCGRWGYSWRPLVFLATVVATITIQAQPRGERVLLEEKDHIRAAATQFHISARLLASIIYTEQSLNVVPGENILDEVFARSGYNSSIGVAQVKLETAEWIERAVNTPSGRCYLGDDVKELISRSQSHTDLIGRLTAPETNLLYAAAYIAIIEKTWKAVLQNLWPRSSRAGVVATVYSRGLVTSDGHVREPHDDPRPNAFGRKAQEFYESLQFRGEFPD